MKHTHTLALSLALAGILCRAVLDVAGCTRKPGDGFDIHGQETVSVVATYDAGRMFNYPAGAWTFGQVSGVEVSRGLFSVSGSLSFDRTGIFERALSCSVTKERGRVVWNASGAMYQYPSGLGRDFVGSVGVRVTLR